MGVFAALDVVAHRTAPFFWIKLVLALSFSATCLLLTREREAWDTFLGVMAALCTLATLAALTINPADPYRWPIITAFGSAAALFVLLTRNKRATLLGVAAIVGFRLLIYLVLRNYAG